MDLQSIRQIKRAKIAHSTSGNNTIIAAVTDKTLVVLSFMLILKADTDFYFTDSAGTPVELLGGSTKAAGGKAGVCYHAEDSTGAGLMQTTRGTGLVLNLGAGNVASGYVNYVEV